MVESGDDQFNFDLDVLDTAENEIGGTVINSIEDLDPELNKAKKTKVKEEIIEQDSDDDTSSKAKKTKKKEEIAQVEEILEIESIEDLNDEVEDTIEEDKDKNKKATEAKTKVEEDKNKTPEIKTNNALKVFGENLQTKGLINFNLEEFDKAEDKDVYFENKVAEKIAEGSKALYEEQIGDLPPEIQELVDLHKQGVPLYNLLEADKRIADYEAIKPESLNEDESLQKDLIRSLLEAQGTAKEKITAKIKRYEDLGTLKDEASEALDTLKDYEKTSKSEMIKEEKERSIAREKQMEDRVKTIENSINSKDNIMGMPLSKDQKKVLIDGILKPVGKTPDGKAYNAIAKAKMDDPELDFKLAYFTLILKGDLSKVEKQAQTKATKKLASVIDEEIAMSKGTTGSQVETTSKFDEGVAKRAMEYLRGKK